MSLSVVWVECSDFYFMYVTSLSVCKTVNFKHLNFKMKLLALALLQVFGRKYILSETGTVLSSV